jgi:hypothetical protein
VSITKEAFDRAVEGHDLDVLVSLERSEDLSELQNKFRPHEVERRVIEGDPPAGA